MRDRESIECFHLMFSHRLSAKMDKALFCLKGGCNLRFYFQSIRYSEDIDFDIQTTSVETLKKNVEKILDDSSFSSLLKTNQGIEILDWSAPKQTEITQRWKVSLKVSGHSLPIPTKIEFSRRAPKIKGAEIDSVQADLISKYKLQIILLNHYSLSRAIEQKIDALIHRTETQARDVLDLQILKNQLPTKMQFPTTILKRKKALETVMSVSFADFKSQVWPYLLPDYQNYYGKPDVWNQIQEDLIEFIETQPKADNE